MVAVLASIVLLAVIGLGFYALHKVKPGRFRIQAGVWRLVNFNIEMDQGSDTPGDRPPREERHELEAGRDKPMELEAGRERDNSGPPGTAGQDDAVA